MNQNAHEPASLPVPTADALDVSAELAAKIRGEIAQAGGWLPFDRYMELALYAPGLGYYSGGARKFGRRADDGSDFVTAPELSPLFAQTLARAVAQALAASGTRRLMEFGAGTGRLAAGMLSGLAALGVQIESYAIVDLSGELRARQRETIEALGGERLSSVQWLDTLPEQFEGVVLGNEVLDAMPIQLYARTAGVWRARGVSVDQNDAFRFDDRTVVLGPNEVMRIPGGVPHEVAVLEDCIVIDVFQPVRQDWLDGTDTYFGRAEDNQREET